MNAERKEPLEHIELAQIPIPEGVGKVDGWKEVPIVENNEPLVPLGPFSDYDDIFTSSIYFGEHTNSPYFQKPLKGSLLTIFARKSVADQLRQARRILQENTPRNEGWELIAYDIYRPLDLQQALFDEYIHELTKLHPDWDQDLLLAETQKYVSLPSYQRERPSPHNTGGAADYVLARFSEKEYNQLQSLDQQITKLGDDPQNWSEVYQLFAAKDRILRTPLTKVNFGTLFDHGGEKAALRFYEEEAQQRILTPKEQEALRYRRVDYHVAQLAGFEPYEHEWWHKNSVKTQMGAKSSGLPTAAFGSVQLTQELPAKRQGLSDQNFWFEHYLRRGHRSGTIYIFEGGKGVEKLSDLSLQQAHHVVTMGVARNGDPRVTTLLEAEAIKPI